MTALSAGPSKLEPLGAFRTERTVTPFRCFFLFLILFLILFLQRAQSEMASSRMPAADGGSNCDGGIRTARQAK